MLVPPSLRLRHQEWRTNSGTAQGAALSGPWIRFVAVADDELDPDVLLAAVIEAVAENLPGDDADVIPLRRSEESDESGQGR